MARKHGEHQSVKEAILSCASSLFIKRGIHGASLGDIAAEAHLSKGTIYYYYPVKDDLILTIAEGCLGYMTDQLLTWIDSLTPSETPSIAITRLFEAFTADERYARLFVVILSECANEDSLLRNLVSDQQQQWKVMLELGALRMQGRCPELMRDGAELFFTLLTGYMLKSLGGMGGLSIESLTATMMKR